MKKLKFLYICLLGAALLSATAVGFAAAGDRWQVQAITENWNALYGTITGLTNLNNGDEIAAFDAAGNCYGVGTYNGIYYFLSVFKAEAGDKVKDDVPIEGDFALPGFEENDIVVLKVYVKADDKEYPIAPTGEGAYKFIFTGNYPPKRLDLVYKAPDDGGGDGGDDGGGGGGGGGDGGVDDGSPGSGIISGGLPYTGRETPKETPKAPLPTTKKAPPEEGPGGPLGYVTEKPGTAPRDYYPAAPSGQTATKRVVPAKPPERASAPYKRSVEPEIKRKPPKLEEFEVTKRGRWPLFLKILLFLLLLALLLLALRKLQKMQEKDDPPKN